jgi:hypothetical protein
MLRNGGFNCRLLQENAFVAILWLKRGFFKIEKILAVYGHCSDYCRWNKLIIDIQSTSHKNTFFENKKIFHVLLLKCVNNILSNNTLRL